MGSLFLNTQDLKGVLKHVYACLGVEEIPKQNLIFFMSYDLLLFKPSISNQYIELGIKEGLLTLKEGALVKFNLENLFQGPGSNVKLPSVVDIIKELADIEIFNRGFAIKKDKIRDISIDGDKGLVRVDYNTKEDKIASISIDLNKKEIVQDVEPDVEVPKGKPYFHKYLISFFIWHKDEPFIKSAIKEIYLNLEAWKFKYNKLA
ncbi:MAG: hypothetical protein ACTSRA_07285 [Promethearchaeota archaeon]